MCTGGASTDIRKDAGAGSCAVVSVLADAGGGSLCATNAGDPAALTMLNTIKVVRTPILKRGHRERITDEFITHCGKMVTLCHQNP